MSIKNVFSIKDLENLSGVKAHTIRIWEKRYNLFKPLRTDTNIRIYGNDELQKILNIALLNRNGLKVSKIAELSEKEIKEKVQEIVIEENPFQDAYNDIKLAMLNFDNELFEYTYQNLLKQNTFGEIFLEVFVQLLGEIGMLWHTNTIKPIHEHFISSLVSQKILLNLEKLPKAVKNKNKTFVLFLPVNESHQIGLLYLHYELILNGFHSIFLGPKVPISNLKDIQTLFNEVEFVSYFTVEPTKENTQSYLDEMDKIILSTRNEKFHVLGRQLENFQLKSKNDNIILYRDLKEFIDYIETLKLYP